MIRLTKADGLPLFIEKEYLTLHKYDGKTYASTYQMPLVEVMEDCEQIKKMIEDE